MSSAPDHLPNPQPRPAATAASFTGRERRRTTRLGVKVVNVLMKYLICSGGIGVVLVFAGIVYFICSVVAPLFYAAKMTEQPAITLTPSSTTTPARPGNPSLEALAIGMDSDLASIWIITRDGRLATYRIEGGEWISGDSVSLQPITAISNTGGRVALGGADGTVRFGQILTTFEYVDPKLAVADGPLPPPGHTVAWKKGVAEFTAAQQLRVVRTVADLTPPEVIGDGPPAAVVALDYAYEEEHEHLVALRADNRLYCNLITKKTNMMTGKIKRELDQYELPAPPEAPTKGQDSTFPTVLMGLNGRMVFLAYPDGRCLRYNTEDLERAFIAEEVDLVPDPSVRLAKVQLLNGNQTLIVTDSLGGVSGWFAAPYAAGQSGKDSVHLVQAHVLENQGASVVGIATSRRDRQFVTMDAAGQVVVRHMTSNTTQGRLGLSLGATPTQIAIAPENNAVVVLDAGMGLHLIRLDNPHADGSLSAMFTKIWYEGYSGPQYVYQSSAGTDDAEPKFSMVPLIFGTLKATFYAMLFSVPIAILGAIYTSEFMHPRTRNVVKPVIEMMASLPSVVLGFVAALVLAPIVGNNLVAVLLAGGLIPMGLASFGYVWQLLPGTTMRRVAAWQRFGLMGLLVLGMVGLAWCIGPAVEGWLFAGDAKAWLSGKTGTATPGWLVLLTPLCFVALSLLFNLRIKPNLKIYQAQVAPLQLSLFELGRGAALILAALGLAAMLGWTLATAGFDLRGSLIGPYIERNSLILGMIMGFAIIPIIYTVSEDALAAVPNTLRSASLGMGATQWQTAIRVVLPVAFPGVFSACMIGFGRAAGETMIVLMASGRTPIIDLSPFTGLSALSANIATELPEAPRDSTHYRMLFMSAVILFALTFIVNTAAEVVRLRYRKRSVNL